MKPAALWLALLAALLVVALLAAGCRKGPPQDEAAIRKSLAERPAAQVLAEAERSAFEPPAAGRLSERQVEMYLAVRRREGRIREVVLEDLGAAGGSSGQDAPGAGPRGVAGVLGTADLRAAQELGYDPKEYQWVEERVLEAEIAAAARGMSARVEAGRRRYLGSLKARLHEAKDPAERASLERRIADFERRADAAPRLAPAVRQNADLLARYRERLASAQAPEGSDQGAAAGRSSREAKRVPPGSDGSR